MFKKIGFGLPERGCNNQQIHREGFPSCKGHTPCFFDSKWKGTRTKNQYHAQLEVGI